MATPRKPSTPDAANTHKWQEHPTGTRSKVWWYVDQRSAKIVGQVRLLDGVYEAFADGSIGRYTKREAAMEAVEQQILGDR